MSSPAIPSQAELKANKVPLGWRDQCSSLLIPLNVCRRDNLYVPWECENERHAYEECQYKDYMRRMKALSKQKLEGSEDA
ncbi:7 NADH dehydrogenase 1 beta subcomplex [Pyrrhoderma noxium]|uniref:NADH dehydrogenase [ubiquinone] 1 beta subcomplex subunit 7 n=1 Tax=Pyrrhoderma noxium TaxID=2282107 RepID=A0A286UY21_9AGAM|nr:7 NADH dehydrogenase 1 beta subcomplex [Pyrrhoderma noxium]